MHSTSSYKNLDAHTQYVLNELYVNYFFKRQDVFWRKEALQKLPALKRVTNMLICGEDLGLVPACVPDVMRELGLLSLEIQRMPKDSSQEFFYPAQAPYLSVITPSTHDMSTLREWWEEDKVKNTAFLQQCDAPEWLCSLLLRCMDCARNYKHALIFTGYVEHIFIAGHFSHRLRFAQGKPA